MKMKRLIPTMSMALLGASLLGTSTYAWFSANKSVTATGISLSAKAGTSLLISTKSDSGFSNNVSLTSASVSGLTPVAYKNTNGTVSVQKLNQTGIEKVGSDGKLSDYENYLTAATAATDYIMTTVYLQYQGSEETDVSFSATIKAQDGYENIYKAVKVGAIVKDGTTYKSDSNISFESAAITKTGGTSESIAADNTFKISSKTLTVDLYLYVNGLSDYCVNSNALKGDSFTIDLTFTAAK